MKKLNKILLALSLFALSGIATAIPITGSIEFDGGYTTDTGDKRVLPPFSSSSTLSM